jgi:predicted nucleotidyltransferase
METTRHKLPEDAELFFKELGEYLDTKIYFYGSVQRGDYFPGMSDIDVSIFTDNENSTLEKLSHFLHIKKSSIKRFIFRDNGSSHLVYGYKTMFKNPEHNFRAEISVYSSNNKKEVLNEHISKMTLPLYKAWAIYILKFLFYNVGIVDKKSYKDLKKYIINKGDEEFVIL